MYRDGYTLVTGVVLGFLAVIGVLALCAGCTALSGFILSLVYNYLAPGFHWPALSFTQCWAIIVGLAIVTAPFRVKIGKD